MKMIDGMNKSKIFKEVLIFCILILFFVILVILGRFIMSKRSSTNEIADNYIVSGDLESGETFLNSISGEKDEYIETFENFDLNTGNVEINEFTISKEEEGFYITGNVKNLTDEIVMDLNLLTTVYNEQNEKMQEISTSIPVIYSKEKSQFFFTIFDNFEEAKKIKVELLDNNDLKDNSTIDIK